VTGTKQVKWKGYTALVVGCSLGITDRFRSGSEILFADVGGTEDPSAPVHVMAAPLAGGLPRLVLQDVGMKGKVTVLL